MPDEIHSIPAIIAALTVAAVLWTAVWLVFGAEKRRLKRIERRAAQKRFEDSVPDDLKLGFLDRMDGLK